MLEEPPVPTLETDMAKQPTQPSLEDLSPKQLQELIERATALKTEKKAETIQALRTRWQEEAAEAGVELREVFPPVIPTPPKAPRKPKEPADPNNPKTPPVARFLFPDDTRWSGRGRIPLGARSYLASKGATVNTNGHFDDKEAGAAALQHFLIPE